MSHDLSGGVVTLTESPQAFVRARIELEGGRQAQGAAAELLAPKWFDKNPALSNEGNFEQLRDSLRGARGRYLEGGTRGAWEHSIPTQGLVENYGPALIDRAVLDALCRGLGVSFYDAVRRNLIGAGVFEGLDLGKFFEKLNYSKTIAARHTVGLVDPITSADQKLRVNDRIPEPYHASLDGNEQYDDFEGVAALGYASAAMPDWKSMEGM